MTEQNRLSHKRRWYAAALLLLGVIVVLATLKPAP